ncbi:MAG: hypothetical protein K2I64_01815 [Muribaculaceae bacterium]|nr:hypothetical protein [Muribaculaceae bacterium]
MKKLLALAMGIILSISSLIAETTPIEKNGREVGNIEWSYSIQTFETRSGSFTTITATNNSREFVKLSFKTDAGGFESMNIPPYETRQVTIGTNQAATRAYLMNIYID